MRERETHDPVRGSSFILGFFYPAKSVLNFGRGTACWGCVLLGLTQPPNPQTIKFPKKQLKVKYRLGASKKQNQKARLLSSGRAKKPRLIQHFNLDLHSKRSCTGFDGRVPGSHVEQSNPSTRLVAPNGCSRPTMGRGSTRAAGTGPCAESSNAIRGSTNYKGGKVDQPLRLALALPLFSSWFVAQRIAEGKEQAWWCWGW